VTAQYDHYRLESLDFAKRLKGLDVDCAITICPGVAHAFDTAPANEVNRKENNDKARLMSWRILSDHLRKHI